MSGYLTTHVLDTAKGMPANNMKIELYRVEAADRVLITSLITNLDGRTETQILPQDQFRTGNYELLFYAGGYLLTAHENLKKPLFLDIIPIRFNMAEETHYHIPLLLSPFSYSTYRGS